MRRVVQDCKLLLEEMSLIERAREDQAQQILDSSGGNPWPQKVIRNGWNRFGKRRRARPAKRVEQAVKELVEQGNPVTLNGIRHIVKALFGVSISANTIQRNEGANAAYQKHRTARREIRARNPALARLLRSLPTAAAVNVRAKIARLRRESKDTLIARLLQLEAERKRQSDREDALREEILRLHPSTGRKGGTQ